MAPPLHPLLPALERVCYGINLPKLIEQSGLDARETRRSLARLERQGLVCQPKPGCYRLTPVGRSTLNESMEAQLKPTPARRESRKTFRARTWRAMRVLKKFTLHDLLVNASTGGEKQPYNQASRFVVALETTGYLVRMRRDGRRVRWILVRDTGPRTPILRHRQKTLYDPNTEEERSYERV